MGYTKNEILNSMSQLYNDIDSNILKLIKARLNHDALEEGKALFKMESLMVDAQQELSFLHDYIEEKIDENTIYTS